MYKNYGNVRYWLWSLLPLLHIATFYGAAWRAWALEGHFPTNPDTSYIDGDVLFSQLHEFSRISCFGMIVGLIVWNLLTLWSGDKLTRTARRTHAFIHWGGWVLNLVLLVTDPGGVISWWMD